MSTEQNLLSKKANYSRTTWIYCPNVGFPLAILAQYWVSIGNIGIGNILSRDIIPILACHGSCNISVNNGIILMQHIGNRPATNIEPIVGIMLAQYWLKTKNFSLICRLKIWNNLGLSDAMWDWMYRIRCTWTRFGTVLDLKFGSLEWLIFKQSILLYFEKSVYVPVSDKHSPTAETNLFGWQCSND